MPLHSRRVARVSPVGERTGRPEFSASNIGPQNLGSTIDPFLSIDHFVMRVPVFPPHPHAGFSALTYLFEDSEGSFTNRDSLGHSLLIRPGELHWTTAGRGIIHEEIPEVVGQRDHGLQIFVNLSSSQKHVAPSVHHLSVADTPIFREGGARARVVLGRSNDLASPLAPPTDVTLLDIQLEPGARFTHVLPKAENAFAYVLRGAAKLGPTSGPTRVRAAHVAGFASDGERIEIDSDPDAGAWLVLFAGVPLGEPVLAYGPFVMNTEDQIERAYADYRAGEMGELAATRSDAWLNQPRR